MSHTHKRRRTSPTRCARRSLVELTALAASRAIDDGLIVLSSGIPASNPRSEHTGEKSCDHIIQARQATPPSHVAGLELRNAAAPRNDELLASDITTDMGKIARDYQNRAYESIKSSLNAALDDAKELLETRVAGEAASKDGVFSFQSNFGSVLKESETGFRADAVEFVPQKEAAESAGQPQPRYMRRLTDEAVRLLDDLKSGKLDNQANFILSECFREAASAFSMINQQLKRDGYAASIDPSIFIWLANITEPETRDTGTMRLEIVPNHGGSPSTYGRQVANFIWHLVEGQGCPREAAYRGALTKFSISASFAAQAYAFWEPIFKRAGPHVQMLTRISDPER